MTLPRPMAVGAAAVLLGIGFAAGYRAAPASRDVSVGRREVQPETPRSAAVEAPSKVDPREASEPADAPVRPSSELDPISLEAFAAWLEGMDGEAADPDSTRLEAGRRLRAALPEILDHPERFLAWLRNPANHRAAACLVDVFELHHDEWRDYPGFDRKLAKLADVLAEGSLAGDYDDRFRAINLLRYVGHPDGSTRFRAASQALLADPEWSFRVAGLRMAGTCDLELGPEMKEEIGRWVGQAPAHFAAYVFQALRQEDPSAAENLMMMRLETDPGFKAIPLMAQFHGGGPGMDARIARVAARELLACGREDDFLFRLGDALKLKAGTLRSTLDAVRGAAPGPASNRIVEDLLERIQSGETRAQVLERCLRTHPIYQD